MRPLPLTLGSRRQQPVHGQTEPGRCEQEIPCEFQKLTVGEVVALAQKIQTEPAGSDDTQNEDRFVASERSPVLPQLRVCRPHAKRLCSGIAARRTAALFEGREAAAGFGPAGSIAAFGRLRATETRQPRIRQSERSAPRSPGFRIPRATAQRHRPKSVGTIKPSACGSGTKNATASRTVMTPLIATLIQRTKLK